MTAIGHNNPPSPFDDISEKIGGLYDEAKNWCDGEPIENQAQADQLNALIGMIRKAEKEADALRKEENALFDAGKAEVQARYAGLIGSTKTSKGKTVLAMEAVKATLQPWLLRLDEAQRAAEAKARAEADEAQKAAEQAMRESVNTDLEAREKAEALLADAKKAEATAKKAENSTAKAKGGTGKASGLRTYHEAEITNMKVFARYVWINHPDDMASFLTKYAQAKVAMQPTIQMDGVRVVETKRVV